MTDPVQQAPHTAAAARDPNAKERWQRPTLARIDTSDAENTANPLGPDAVLTQGS